MLTRASIPMGMVPLGAVPKSIAMGCSRRHGDRQNSPSRDPLSPFPCSQGHWHQLSPPHVVECKGVHFARTHIPSFSRVSQMQE